jgi:hypothetical protein
MKNLLMTITLVFLTVYGMAQNLSQLVNDNASFTIYLKKPGNAAEPHILSLASDGVTLKSQNNIPVALIMELQDKEGNLEMAFHLQADEDININFHGQLSLPDLHFESAQMLLPGFWYRKNQRSPDDAPSVKTSNNWLVREDRLSTPMTALYDQNAKKGYALIRSDVATAIGLTTHQSGEVILGGPTNMGALGFGEIKDVPFLYFAFPYSESPHSYYRKLTLGDPIQSFLHLAKGESISFSYELSQTELEDFANFVAHQWSNAYDMMAPVPIEQQKFSDHEIKSILTEFYKSSYIETGNLKGFSGVHLETETCTPVDILEIGFIGRVLLNAF